MKRSQINHVWREASACFARHGWALPPEPRWDITDFGLGTFDRYGLTLINLAEEPEYCEKLMFARAGQETPAHYHRQKKEDIICRWGRLQLTLWAPGDAPATATATVEVKVNGALRTLSAGEPFVLSAGERITLEPGLWHAFVPVDGPCIIGEVSTANDDAHDNFFANPDIGRFPGIEEDEPAAVRIISEDA